MFFFPVTIQFHSAYSSNSKLLSFILLKLTPFIRSPEMQFFNDGDLKLVFHSFYILIINKKVLILCKKLLSKGHSRISMVWVLPFGCNTYCVDKWLPLQDKFTLSINSKKFYYGSCKQILKHQKIKVFLKRFNRS